MITLKQLIMFFNKMSKAIKLSLVAVLMCFTVFTFAQAGIIDPDAAKEGENTITSVGDFISLLMRPINTAGDFTILVSVIFGALGIPLTYVLRSVFPKTKAPVKNFVIMLAATLFGTVLLFVIPGEFTAAQVFTQWFNWSAWSALIYSLVTSIWMSAKTSVVVGEKTLDEVLEEGKKYRND